jgi:hypothetical protein
MTDDAPLVSYTAQTLASEWLEWARKVRACKASGCGVAATPTGAYCMPCCLLALAAACKAKGEVLRDELQTALCHPSTYDGGNTPLDEYGKRVLRVAIEIIRAHAADVPAPPEG